MSLNPFHIYVPEGQGVLVGLEDPKNRAASVSEIPAVYSSISLLESSRFPTSYSIFSLKPFRRQEVVSFHPPPSSERICLHLAHSLCIPCSQPLALWLSLMPHPQVLITFPAPTTTHPAAFHLLKATALFIKSY